MRNNNCHCEPKVKQSSDLKSSWIATLRQRLARNDELKFVRTMLFTLFLSACAIQPIAPKVNEVASPKYPMVTPPKCPDWSEENYGINLENRNSSNYSCSTVNNMGQMIANPNDMIIGRGGNSYNSDKSNAVINSYIKGDAE